MSQLSSVAKQPLKKCAGCGKDGANFKHCGGCLSVFYCSSACQSTSWAGHKAACKRIRLLRIKEEKEKEGSDAGDTGSKPQPHLQPQSLRYSDRDIAVACQDDQRGELQKILQQSGLDVNWANPADGATAAIVAASKGHGECLSMIIEYKGADLSKRSKKGEAPIHAACMTGRIACLLILLDHGIGVNVRTADAYSFTPIHLCCLVGHVKCLALLVDRKADPDLANSDGLTAAHGACVGNQLKCLQLLIARRANINQKDAAGKTPLDLARHNRQHEFVELLLENHAVGMRAEEIPTQSEAEKVRPHL
jgi:ankyrin repeat protein